MHAFGSVEPGAQAEPAAQVKHSSATVRSVALPKVPPGQSVGCAVPASQNLPGEHGKQAVSPRSGWYLPGAQASQMCAEAVGMKLPGIHAVGADEPTLHALPGGHAWQSVCALLLVTLPKVPSSQGEGAALRSGQKDPVLHAWHLVCPPRVW